MWKVNGRQTMDSDGKSSHCLWQGELKTKNRFLVQKKYFIKKEVFFLLVYITFNNISVISWCSFLLLGGNWTTQREPTTCHKSLTNFHHKMLNQVQLTMAWIKHTTLVVIHFECLGGCKSNYSVLLLYHLSSICHSNLSPSNFKIQIKKKSCKCSLY